MSAQEARNIIVRDNLLLLLKALTGFEEKDENYSRCKQFAFGILRNHRTISINSHEVRRKIDDMKEKFRFDNLLEESGLLGCLCEEIIDDPVFVGHYEMDVHWSLIDMLLSLAFNPTRSIRKLKKKQRFRVQKRETYKPENVDLDYWRSILNINEEPNVQYLNRDDLSDWSEDDSFNASSVPQDYGKEVVLKELRREVKVFNRRVLETPKEQYAYVFIHYDEYSYKLNHQNNWPYQQLVQTVMETNLTSNFACIFNAYLNQKYLQSAKCLIEISSEYSLMKEIVWMLHKPLDCKFFYSGNGSLCFKENISIPRVTPDVLKYYVEDNFLLYIEIIKSLQVFIENIRRNDNKMESQTFDSYAALLGNTLDLVWKEIIGAELMMMKPYNKFIRTITAFKQRLRDIFSILKDIHYIHERIILDIKKNPPHILTMFMLTKLLQLTYMAETATKSNLAAVIFLTVLKTFCQLLDKWWLEGCIDDLNKEFVMESIKADTIGLNRIRCFSNSSPKIHGNQIASSRFFRLLVDHCLEASSILSFLYKINRVSVLREATGETNGQLYDNFIKEVLTQIRFLTHCKTISLSNGRNIKNFENYLPALVYKTSFNPFPEINDDHLSLAFNCEKPKPFFSRFQSQFVEDNLKQIYNELEKSNSLIPFEEVTINVLNKLLLKRVNFANSYVIQMFLKDFGLTTHLRNVRLVFLLEASDLMFQFFNGLFEKIETGVKWANPYILTSDLNDLLCSKYARMNAMFSIAINSNLVHISNKVCHVIEEIFIDYNIPRELSCIFTTEALRSYNKIFQLLLKLKWGIDSLGKMHFVRNVKRSFVFEIGELLMRRLEQLRFWMIHDLQIIQFHLNANVLQSMCQKLDNQLDKCTNLNQIKGAHKRFLETICNHCCLMPNLATIKLGIEQLINLVFVLRLEWKGCSNYMQSISPLSIALDDNLDNGYVANNQVDAIEVTFVRCHQYLANHLNKEVYVNQNDFLSGLSCEFNASLPY